MIAQIGQYVGGKVLSAILIVLAGAMLIWAYRNPDRLEAIGLTLRAAGIWLGFVLILPWATFFATRWVIAKDRNSAGALLLGGYFLADVAFALYLAGFQGHGTLTWAVMVVGFLAAGFYNFVVTDVLATWMQGEPA